MSTYRSREKKGRRAVRKKSEDVKSLSITSLLDVLTIILVFLMKNVSMEAVKINELPDMQYPTTMTKDALMENPMVTPVKLYTDRVLLGIDNAYLGEPQDLIENVSKRALMQEFFRNEWNAVPEDKWDDACLVVQADSNLPCGYITEIVRVGTNTGYQNIYFATLEEADWLKSYGPAASR
ncbi:MAG: biopolymer transporter ExbD [Candidatus Cloacimonadaceae bacterium]|jgi:biopolymer transport protein ExbD|nr:biopolymer transporter ExbD [Candidatus Cloacimonadota bacterium]MDY0127472.1 biopolymer transporter ExbD [Candidatus Cloacimonadaceae bacterium]MCB5254565.1 biopolymer transporter ExbD [Candidatus Cloacimonadota bacterium]MCK9178524.1 biopolymer transporter ExbD [Candidatus Cloacimonadota bacterium]MCK9241869.1 biopolymer transporter ExbD [Candidatus Cloacimonadota bacterium]